jgi:hypothetical protein
MCHAFGKERVGSIPLRLRLQRIEVIKFIYNDDLLSGFLRKAVKST